MTDKKDSIFRRFENMTSLSVLAGFVVVIVLLQLIISVNNGELAYPTFITPVNLLNILMQVAVPGIAAVGMSLVIISGAIDLSVGLLMSLVSIVTAQAMAAWGMSPWLAVLAGIAASVVCEGVMGFIISRVKVEPFIITLGGMMAFRGIALLVCNSREVVLNGQLDIFKTNLIEGLRDPVNNLKLTLPIYVIVFLVTVVLFWLVMKYTKFGRRVYAVGCNAQAAYLSGVNVRSIKLLIFLINGVLTGVAAVLLLSRVNVGIISLGEGLEIDVIAMVVIGGAAMSGGKGNIWGTFIGILLLGSISNAMNMLRIPSAMQFMVKGFIIIASVTIAALSAEGLKPMDVLRRLAGRFTKAKE